MLMNRNIVGLYFSPCGTTKTVVDTLARAIAKVVGGGDYFSVDLTSFDDRRGVYEFSEEDVVIIGCPTYAGRVPNKIAPYFAESIFGDGAVGIAVSTYGNRAYDDSLKELVDIMSKNDFAVVSALAVVAEHAFTDKLATGRPTAEDIAKLEELGERIGKMIASGKIAPLTLSSLPGREPEEMQYYRPKKDNGEPANFLAAKVVTDTQKCDGCGECREICPMGCFRESVSEPTGTCIKCQACVKRCPNGAKSFEDEEFLSHVRNLEANYADTVNNIESFGI